MFGDPYAAVQACAPAGVRVCDEVPVSRPARFFTVDYLPVSGGFSGTKARVLSRRRLLIYAWGVDISDARTLCEGVRESLLVYRGDGVRGVDIVGEPARRDDLESKHRRFVMTVDLWMRATS